jgi:hypothetical protein
LSGMLFSVSTSPTTLMLSMRWQVLHCMPSKSMPPSPRKTGAHGDPSACPAMGGRWRDDSSRSPDPE